MNPQENKAAAAKPQYQGKVDPNVNSARPDASRDAQKPAANRQQPGTNQFGAQGKEDNASRNKGADVSKSDESDEECSTSKTSSCGTK